MSNATTNPVEDIRAAIVEALTHPHAMNHNLIVLHSDGEIERIPSMYLDDISWSGRDTYLGTLYSFEGMDHNRRRYLYPDNSTIETSDIEWIEATVAEAMEVYVELVGETPSAQQFSQTTRVVGTLESGWDADGSAHGYGDAKSYRDRVRAKFDAALEADAEACGGGVLLYREGDQIIASADYEGWDSGRCAEILDAAHEWAQEMAEMEDEGLDIEALEDDGTLWDATWGR